MNRRRILFCSAALSAMVFATAAAAEDSSTELVVTGSRIPRANLQSATPTVTVTTQKIEANSSVEIGAVLRDLPAAGISFASPQTTGALTTTDFGLSTFNLRNLGENRTLVLVDGRRFVSGSISGNFVDLNAIPAEMVSRIDVVTGGASAIYGSDALAGVVNIITKRSFTGLVVSAQGGKGTYGDAETYKVSATGGAVFADGAGAAVLSLGWSKDNGAYARNRPFEAIDSIADVALGGPTDDIVSVTQPFFSSYSEKGRINLTDGSRFVVDDDGVVKPFSTARDGFNRQAFRGISAPLERLDATLNIDYRVAPWAKWFAQVSYASTRARVTAEPFPLDSYNIYGANFAANQAQCVDNAGVTQCIYGIPLTSAIVPEAIRVVERARQPGVPDQNLVVGFSRRMTEIGTRNGESLRQTYRLATGFTGDLPAGFTYDTSFVYGRTSVHQHSGGQVNTARMRLALDAIVGPGGVLQCRDATARLEGCLPINIFGRGKISAAATQYVLADNSRDSVVQQVVANAFVQGPVLELPGGATHLVVGGEYRRERLDDVPDALTQTGGNASNKIPPTHGNYNVIEGFVELRAPLLKDLTLVRSLDVDLSARFSHYSTVGQTTAYAANVEWKPVDQLRLRAQYAHSVRAPNLFELFSPGSQTFPTVNDPCQGVTRASGGRAAFLNDVTDLSSGVDASTIGNVVATNCLADPNIAKRVTDTGGLVLSQPELQGVSGFNSGNPNLKAETSNSYTAGFVLNPDWAGWLRPATLSVDWYMIKLAGGIGIFGTQLTTDQCYQTASPVYCAQIVRNGAGSFQGSLGFVNQINLNLSTITSQGVDIQFDYRLGLGMISPNAGELTLSALYTRLLDLTTVPFPGAAPTLSTGVLGAPVDRANIDLTYHNGPFRLLWNVKVIGAVTVDGLDGSHIPVQSFHAFQAAFDVRKNLTLVAGVDNAFDNFVFIGGTSGEIGSSVVATTVGQRTEPTSYDALGRRWYAAVKFRF